MNVFAVVGETWRFEHGPLIVAMDITHARELIETSNDIAPGEVADIVDLGALEPGIYFNGVEVKVY